LLMDSAELSLSGSNVTCEFSLPDDLWPIEMDCVQIRQVIHNLMINGREAMPEGGVIAIEGGNVTVTAESDLPIKEGKYVKWSVKDRGNGIPREILHRILDPYFTTKPKANARGAGLGLAICNSIVKKHDGFIEAQSEPGAGSVFSVYLPACLPPESVDSVIAAEGDSMEKRVLVMEGDDTIRDAISIVLNYLGYEVASAKDGGEAVGLYKTAREKGKPFSVVVLDLYVQDGGGGKDVLRELLAMDPSVKAIAICSDPEDQVVLEFARYGFSGVVDVPYDIEKMKTVLGEGAGCELSE
jgi:two-component system cell cycle sensor histidine kinase/response regulator CckA